MLTMTKISSSLEKYFFKPNGQKKVESIFFLFSSCLVRLLKEWIDQNAKKRMSDSRGQQREKRERQWCYGKEKG